MTLAQGRTLSWLAHQTGKSARTIYAYSRGDLVPSDDWLEAVGQILGEPVGNVPQQRLAS